MPLQSRLAILVIASLLGIFASQTDGQAAEAKAGLNVELNTMRQVGSACRVAFVIKSTLNAGISDLTFEIVLFGKDQSVISLLLIGAGQMPAGKTRVKQFDLKKTSCANIARVLLNDVSRCKGEDLTPAKCLNLMQPSSRLDVPFVL